MSEQKIVLELSRRQVDALCNVLSHSLDSMVLEFENAFLESNYDTESPAVAEIQELMDEAEEILAVVREL